MNSIKKLALGLILAHSCLALHAENNEYKPTYTGRKAACLFGMLSGSFAAAKCAVDGFSRAQEAREYYRDIVSPPSIRYETLGNGKNLGGYRTDFTGQDPNIKFSTCVQGQLNRAKTESERSLIAFNELSKCIREENLKMGYRHSMRKAVALSAGKCGLSGLFGAGVYWCAQTLQDLKEKSA